MSQSIVIGFRDVIKPEDDVIAITPECSLLPCEKVDALCMSIDKTYFAPYRKTKLVFNFKVVEPSRHAGVQLQMFVNIDERWRKGKLAKSSKLLKCVRVACGPIAGRQPIRYSMFTNKIFRCALRTVTSDAGQYSVIEMLLEKLTS